MWLTLLFSWWNALFSTARVFFKRYPYARYEFRMILLTEVGRASRSLWTGIRKAATADFGISTRIDSGQEAYHWVIHYLAVQNRHLLRHPAGWADWLLECVWPVGRVASSHFQLSLSRRDSKEWDVSKIRWIPLPEGRQYVRFNGRTIKITLRSVKVDAVSGHLLMLSTTSGTHSYFVDFLAEARRMYLDQGQDGLRIHQVPAREPTNWARVALKEIRPWESVILPPGVKEGLLEDAQAFFADKSFYLSRGLPYRRGYLFYGEPGTGKSSIIAALAAKLKLDLYNMSLTSGVTDDSHLMTLIDKVPNRSLLLIEDIDCAVRDRASASKATIEEAEVPSSNGKKTKSSGPPKGSQITLSGLLNALDGVAASEGRLLICTTNHIDRIDNALSRPGRCDLFVRFTFAIKSQIKELFLHFYTSYDGDAQVLPALRDLDAKLSERVNGVGDPLKGTLTPPPTPPSAGEKRDELSLESLAEAFAATIPEGAVTCSAIQGYLMRHKRLPQRAVAEVDKWVGDGFPQSLVEHHTLI